jgi:hypothetical protein
MFVGTSAVSRDNNIGLLADMLRVKQGDLIFFYIEAMTTLKGRFFGVFKASDNVVYHLTGDEATQPNLSLKLIYRKKIKPFKVFPAGVLEWIALDKLPTYSKELLWSLIYRKLKGGRGNTMLLPWETERLISLIEDANAGQSVSGQHYSLDSSTCTIQRGDRTDDHNIGQPVSLPLEDIKKGETAFQAYILQNLSVGDNSFCPEIFGKNIAWIGNEVFAGLGMQKIDILTIEKLDETSYIYRIIELKHPKSAGNLSFAPEQLRYYVNWACEDFGGHLLGGKKFNIKPILLVFTQQFNLISQNIISEISQLNSISTNPEIWEMNAQRNVNKIL